MGPAQEKILSSLLTAHRLGRQASLPGRTSIFVYEMIFWFLSQDGYKCLFMTA